MPTIAASIVVELAGAGGAPAYQIVTAPETITEGADFSVSIRSPLDFSLASPYGGLYSKTTAGAGERYEEIVDLSGPVGPVSTQAPVAVLVAAVCQTPWVSAGAIVYPAGDPAIKAGLKAQNGGLFRTIGGAGSVRLIYDSYPVQSWVHRGLPDAGLYVLRASAAGVGVVDVPISVQAAGDSSGNRPLMVTVQARDYTTDLPIEGAAVYVDGIYRGVTDADGRRAVGILPAGVHSVAISASGYLATGADSLSNDSFQI